MAKPYSFEPRREGAHFTVDKSSYRSNADDGGLSRLHSADEDAVSWLTNYGKWHAYEKKKNADENEVAT